MEEKRLVMGTSQTTNGLDNKAKGLYLTVLTVDSH